MTARPLALAAAAILLLTACPQDEDPTTSTTGTPSNTSSEAGCTRDQRMDVYSSGGVVHTDSPSYSGPLAPRDNPQYTVNPPSGGDHLTPSVRPGIYRGADVPPDGNLVHTLEHGYVILWFQPSMNDGPLRAAFDAYPRDTLVVERVDMPTPVAATAWGQRLLCQSGNANVLKDFVLANRNKAPEKVPH